MGIPIKFKQKKVPSCLRMRALEYFLSTAKSMLVKIVSVITTSKNTRDNSGTNYKSK